MMLTITEYPRDEAPRLVIDLEDVPETDITIEIGNAGIEILGMESTSIDHTETYGDPIIGGVIIMQWTDAITLYQQYEDPQGLEGN